MIMDIVVLILEIILVVLAIPTVTMEYLRDLQMFQQNSYRIKRYRKWLSTSGDTTTFNRLLILVGFFAMLYLRTDWCLAVIPMAVIVGDRLYRLGTAKYKKPLVLTKRAWRIISVMTVLEAGVVALFGNLCDDVLLGLTLGFVAAYLLSHIVLVVSALMLMPVERMINRRYYNDAARILRSMPSLKIVGITGSYGKTSTKHYLHRILSEKFDTLMTPGSFNTTLGVIRTVREHLKPYNEGFIVEMGAKQPGDIKEICVLVHPAMGIITAVGEQHLESFKSIENVQRTKFELADALPYDGLAVVNNDFEYAANRPVDNVRAVHYGVSNHEGADVTVTDIEYDATGTTFTVVDAALGNLTLHTRLVGECNVSNLVAAVIVARAMGVEDDKIRYAVEKIEQVEHRLNVKRTPGGITIIDDAFNSNPTGSRMAMDVLASMKGGKRIVITPGMIELGQRQAELNTQLGRHIASSCDVAILVGEYNREALLAGIVETRGGDSDIHAVDTFADAQRLLATIAAPGDTVLYENDLPDTFK